MFIKQTILKKCARQANCTSMKFKLGRKRCNSRQNEYCSAVLSSTFRGSYTLFIHLSQALDFQFSSMAQASSLIQWVPVWSPNYIVNHIGAKSSIYIKTSVYLLAWSFNYLRITNWLWFHCKLMTVFPCELLRTQVTQSLSRNTRTENLVIYLSFWKANNLSPSPLNFNESFFKISH